jgi:putative hydrolase of the HAD superfamily
MANVSAIFWDIGGVLATNGWDRYARADAVRRFGLDAAEFERRHQEVVDDFEMGRMSFELYLERTVFHEGRDFDQAAFRDFMFAQSRPHEDALAVARAVAASGRYRMAVLSNESRELNDYRIQAFGLRDIFGVFFSSCYVGLRKPDAAIFRLAIDVTQKRPDECLMIDDRQENIDAAIAAGMRAALHRGGASELLQELAEADVGP